MTAFENGQQVQNPLTEERYVKDYGPVEGPQRYANYQQAAVMGADIASMRMMPVDEQQAVIEKYKPDPNAPGYELATKREAAIKMAQAKLNTQRGTDPVEWAQKNGLTDQKPIDWNDVDKNPNQLALTLSSRAGLAASMTEKFGTQPLLLSKSEASRLVAGFDNMDETQKAAYLR